MRRSPCAVICLPPASLVAPGRARPSPPRPCRSSSSAFHPGAGRRTSPILVEIDASWCPNCAKQRPILAKLSADPAFEDLLIMKVDFDTQKDIVREMGANMQSTLIAFHGKDERGRSVGVTDEAAIRALVAKTES